MALGKKLMNVNTTEKISEEEKLEKDIGQDPEKDTAKEPERTPAAGQRSLKEILNNIGDEEFILTVPIGREDKENE